MASVALRQAFEISSNYFIGTLKVRKWTENFSNLKLMSFDTGPDYAKFLFSSKILEEKRKTSQRAIVKVSVTLER